MQLYAELGESETGREAGEWIACFDARDQRQRIKKIEAIIRPSTFDNIRTALQELSVEMIVSDVRSCGRQDVRKQFYRGTEYDALVPKVKLEMLVPTARLAEVVKVFSRVSQPANTGAESSVLVCDVATVVRIPSGLRAESAVLTGSGPTQFNDAGSL